MNDTTDPTSDDSTSDNSTSDDSNTSMPARAPSPSRYLAPGAINRRLMNPLVNLMTRLGISVWGSRVLEVRGRKSGELRTTPVNLLTIESERYLVAPRGETAWVKNVRAAGGATLRVGRRREQVELVELADDAKPAILRAYLRRWKWEVGTFFDGIDVNATDADLLAVAPGYPVFRVA
jgi:deazaflavin-dependent oxidoreductase (nitroreductase family)